jgi:hypothetical protein
MQFIIFHDDVGAEFSMARINRREVIFPEGKNVVRLRPSGIRPVEVIQPADKAARAAGGFLLFGAFGAALGVLSSKGPAVRFELQLGDGSTRQGLIEQARYGALRRKIEKLQTYRTGDLRRKIAFWAILALVTMISCAAMGPLGLVVGPGVTTAGKAFLDHRKDRLAAQAGMVTALLLNLTGCATTPYDFPVPVMVGNEQGVSMTGYMATDDEAVVRRRLEERMRCPAGLDIVSLETVRADNKVGTRILQYRAIMKCRTPAA